MMQEQWSALEEAYRDGRTRAIGVSNYCSDCLRCIATVATVMPHVNQFQLHAGMLHDADLALAECRDFLHQHWR